MRSGRRRSSRKSIQSGLRGRGGAGFPTGIKWRTVAETAAGQKYIVCNADEGDSGTFADRMIMEGDPFVLIEGMAIAGFAVGATKGYVYSAPNTRMPSTRHRNVRSPRRGAAAFSATRSAALAFAFDIEVRVGAGAYVCGEETALLESLEGKRGERARRNRRCRRTRGCSADRRSSTTSCRWRPPRSSSPRVRRPIATIGIGRSRGTMPIQLAGNVKYGGLFETAFGITLGELVDDIGGGTWSGRPVRAVQVGGPLGAYFPRALFDTPFDYEAFAARDGLIGHGGIVVFDDTVDMARQARFAMEFCAIESCGKCTPCRIGSTRGVEVIDRIVAGDRPRGKRRASRGFVPYDEVRFAVRPGRLHAISGDERAQRISRRISASCRRMRAPRRGDRSCRSCTRSTSARRARRRTDQVTLTIDGDAR